MNTLRKHNRKLGLLGADMVVVRFKVDRIRLMQEVRDEVERWIIESGYLDGAPFEWITLSLRFGLKDAEEPSYERVNEKYGDLPMSIELDARNLQSADEEQAKLAFLAATLKALIHAAQKFGLNIDQMSRKLSALRAQAEKEEG